MISCNSTADVNDVSYHACNGMNLSTGDVSDATDNVRLPRLASQELLAIQDESVEFETDYEGSSNVCGSTDSGGGAGVSSDGYGMARMHLDSDSGSSYVRGVVNSLPPSMLSPLSSTGSPLRLRQEDDERREVAELERASADEHELEIVMCHSLA